MILTQKILRYFNFLSFQLSWKSQAIHEATAIPPSQQRASVAIGTLAVAKLRDAGQGLLMGCRQLDASRSDSRASGSELKRLFPAQSALIDIYYIYFLDLFGGKTEQSKSKCQSRRTVRHTSELPTRRERGF